MRVLLLSVALLAATPALSLSCLRPDPVRAFQDADESPDAWIIVEGRLIFDESKLPKSDVSRQTERGRGADIPALIKGKSLGQGGFTRAFSQQITLRAQCLAAWCGSASSGQGYLTFLKREGGGYVAFADPCGSKLFDQVTAKQKNALVACFNGGPCKADF